MSMPPNRPMARASTEPALRRPLPLRQLGQRRTMATHRATSSLSLSVGGLRAGADGNEPATPQIASQIAPQIAPQIASQPAALRIDAAGPAASAREAELARRAAHVYRDGPQQIMPYLYLGGEGNVSRAQLARRGITRVLNVAREVRVDAGAGVELRHLRWDHDERDVARYFAACFAFIDGARTGHGGVLVHCQLGVSRSASLVVAYVMRTMRMAFGDAYEYVRRRAPCISPNISLVAQLGEFGRALERERLVISTRVGAALPELTSASSENSSSDGSVDGGLRALPLPLPAEPSRKPGCALLESLRP